MSSPAPGSSPGAPRGGPGPRGAPGRGRGFPRGRGRGGPRGRGFPRGRGGPPRGRGGPARGAGASVTALGLDSHVKVVSDQPKSTERVQYSSSSNKRHSKIQIKNQPLSTQGLDIEGLENTRKDTSVTVNKSGGGGLAARWQAQMAQQKEDDFQKNRDKLRGRRRGGVKFMDTQIRNLITEMKRLSAGPGSGMATVTYGTLFDNTIDSMPALSATLAVAKKRDVVKYEGDMLMQGVHSNVLITLIADQIEDTPDFQSIIGAEPIRLGQPPAESTFSTSMCCQCNKTVYPMDRVSANGKTMHKTCFKCCECNITLKLANFAYNGGKFYCENHFQQKFRQGTSYDF